MYSDIQDAPKLRKGVYTQWCDPSPKELTDPSLAKPGVFAKYAASLLMKCLYMARMIRQDISWTIGTLARYVTKWTLLQDKWMHRVFSYLFCNPKLHMHFKVVSSDKNALVIQGYPDGDHAGALDSAKSTSGGVVVLQGPNGTDFTLDWYSSRQTATAHSTPEAELLSASKMLRCHLLPLIILWEALLGRPVGGVINEDNEATIRIITEGYSAQLRHIQKTHRISISLVHDACYNDPNMTLKYIKR